MLLTNFGLKLEKWALFLNQHIGFSDQVSTFKVQLRQEQSEIRLYNCSHKLFKGYHLSSRQLLEPSSRGNTQNANVQNSHAPGREMIVGQAKSVWLTSTSLVVWT